MVEGSNRQPFVPKQKPAIKMPPGFRFKPTDGELVFHYLKRKALNKPLRPNIIEEVDLYSYSPDALTGDPKYEREGVEEWYFFTPRERKYPNGVRPRRTAGDGFWKATGADKEVKIGGKTVGLKKTLNYVMGKPPNGKKKTNWIMHEFVLSDPPRRERAGIDDMRLDDWVLCRIYKNTKRLRGASNEAEVHVMPLPDATPLQAEMTIEQHCDKNNIPPAEVIVMEKKEEQNGSINIIPPQIEQFHQLGDYNNMLPHEQAAYYNYGIPLYNDNGYGASTSTSAGLYNDNGYGASTSISAGLYNDNGYGASTSTSAGLYNDNGYGASTSTSAGLYNDNGYGASTSTSAGLYNDNGYGASTSTSAGLMEFPQSLDLMFPQQDVSWNNFIPTEAPPVPLIPSILPPSEFEPMGQYPQQLPFPSFPPFPSDLPEFSEEDAYLLNLKF